MSREDGPKLLVVGLDGACRSVLDSFVDPDAIPTLRRLLDVGASGGLRSQIPPWTASAWPSMVTGKNPGKHGVYDFLSFTGYEWDVVNATHVRERAIWELLDDHGFSSVVVNVPVTHPARPIDGAVVPGMTAPEDPTCHPEGILDDVIEAIGAYRIYPQSGPEPVHSIEGYERTVACRGAAFRYLTSQFDPDFGFLQFQVTDSVCHERPGDLDALTAVYSAVDDEIARTIEATDPDTVLVVSDHGIGPVEGPEFRINEFLRSRGDLVGSSGGEGMPDWSQAWENDLLDGNDPEKREQTGIQRAMTLGARFGITTQRVAGALEAVGLARPIGRRVPNDLIRAASEQVDFPQSRVYLRSKSELGLRINLAGREPNGQVPRSAYESVRTDVIEALRGVRTPEGSPVFEDVGPREEYFDGPEVEDAPDVVCVPRDFDTAITGHLGMEPFGEPREPWNHKREGMITAAGHNVDESASIAGASLFDVAPTICAFFGIPVDDDMDGTVLPIVEKTDRASYPTYEASPINVSESGEEFVEERLSDLGYL